MTDDTQGTAAEPLTAEAFRDHRDFMGHGFTVDVRHEWGALFCADCGAWPDDEAAQVACAGPTWRGDAARESAPVGPLDAEIVEAERAGHEYWRRRALARESAPVGPGLLARWPEANLFAALDAEGWFRGMTTAEATRETKKVYRRFAALASAPRASVPEGTRLVLMTDNLLDVLAETGGSGITWKWGEPDENGWYAPTFTRQATTEAETP